MRSSAAEVPRSPSNLGRYGGGPCRRRSAAAHADAVLVAGLGLLLLASPFAAAGTFPVLQEQVRTGTTNGIAGVQAQDGLREILTEAAVPSSLSSSPVDQNVTAGSQVAGAFPADAASADGTYLEYRETTSGPTTARSNPATTAPGCTWTACDSGRLSDNVSATSALSGDVAMYGSFNLGVPPSAAIKSVELGYEAFDPSGNDHLSLEISWDGGTSWCPAFVTSGLPVADPNAYTFVNVTACAGHTWAPADFGANLSLRFTHVVLGGADTIDLDANAVRVTYQPLAYRLSVQYDWDGLPFGQAYRLNVTGHVSNESVSVQVLTPPSSWSTRLAINGTTDEALSYMLAPAELASGNVSIRFVDALGSSPTPSDLWVDLAEIASIRYAYRLDVVQNVTGITGNDPTLTVEGNISAGGENFDVFAWDFSANAWGLVLPASFTATNAVHTVALTSNDLANGSVQIDFRDHDAASPVPATLTLDLVRVETADAAAAFPWTVVLGGVAAGALLLGMIVLVFGLPRRRRSAAEDAEPRTAEAAAVRVPPDAAEEGPTVPVVDAQALEPGHAYLIEAPEEALGALEALTRMGHSGLVITRRPASEVEGLPHPRHTTRVVLGDEPGAVAGPVTTANEDAILSVIDAFLRTNPVGVVLFDGLSGLAGPGGFPAVLDVIERTAARVSQGQQLVLASAPPGSLQAPDGTRLHELFELVRVSAPRPRTAASA